jgi:hypothetical protein
VSPFYPGVVRQRKGVLAPRAAFFFRVLRFVVKALSSGIHSFQNGVDIANSARLLYGQSSSERSWRWQPVLGAWRVALPPACSGPCATQVIP